MSHTPVEPAYGYHATSTIRALEAMALRPCSASNIAATLEIHPRTARRLLHRLQFEGWIEKCDPPIARAAHYRTTDRILIVALVHSAQRHGLALTPRAPAAEAGAEYDRRHG